MRTFISTFLIASAVLVPPLALAGPLLAITGSHPNAIPPTKAPAEPLPPTPLPDGKTIISVSTTSNESPASPSTESSMTSFTFTNIAVLLTIGMALILLLLVNIGWFFRQKRKTN